MEGAPGIPVEQVMEADPDKEVVEEVTVSKLADGTYCTSHFRKLDGDVGEGSNAPGLTRERALAMAASLLTK